MNGSSEGFYLENVADNTVTLNIERNRIIQQELFRNQLEDMDLDELWFHMSHSQKNNDCSCREVSEWSQYLTVGYCDLNYGDS